MCIISSEKCETFQRIKIFQKWINYILILRNDKYIFLFKLILKNLVGGERTWFPYFYRRFTSNKDFYKSQNIERNLQNRTFSKFVILYPLFFSSFVVGGFVCCCFMFCFGLLISSYIVSKVSQCTILYRLAKRFSLSFKSIGFS